MNKLTEQSFKRYCKTMKLKDDDALIEEYKRAHKTENRWPEIEEGMREVGILDMEIYIHQNQLFMIMDTVPDFNHDDAMKALAQKPRQAEWERYVSQFQQTGEEAAAEEKWQLMKRMYKMNSNKNDQK